MHVFVLFECPHSVNERTKIIFKRFLMFFSRLLYSCKYLFEVQRFFLIADVLNSFLYSIILWNTGTVYSAVNDMCQALIEDGRLHSCKVGIIYLLRFYNITEVRITGCLRELTCTVHSRYLGSKKPLGGFSHSIDTGVLLFRSIYVTL